MTRSRLSPFVAVLALSCALPVLAAAPAGDTTTELDTVVVVGSRAAEPLRQVVGSVSAVERDQLERAGVAHIGDLERLIPGLAVPADAARFGRLGFNLRGLDGNRVSIEVDGVPLPDAFSVGQFAFAGRDLVDLLAIQRIEVLRGPASTLYGSKALAGVVAYTTSTAADLLRHGREFGVGGRLGYDGRDEGRLAAAHVAAEHGAWSALLQVARRDGHASDNNAGAGEMPANPASTRRDGLLAKFGHDAGGAGHYTLTFEAVRGRHLTDVQSLVFGPGRYVTTSALDGDDRWRRSRASLAAQWQQPWTWLDSLDLLVYHQLAATAQATTQYRLADAQTRHPTLRERRFDLAQDSTGAKLVAQSRGDWLGLSHWQVYGIDLARHDYRSVRDGRETNLDSGAWTHVVLGEQLPVRDFPLSRVSEAGVFWQDEISLGAQWALVPGVRGERYRMQARSDPLWLADNPTQPLASIASTRWTPKLGLRHTRAAHTFYLQAVRGYRAPPFSDVNIGLYLPTFNYRVAPNPHLRAETSIGLEAGWRWQQDEWQASVALYDNRFRDLIESRANLGVDPATGMQVFQSVNRDRARIRGVELEARWQAGVGRGRLQGWFAELRASAGHGDDTARRQPLNSVQPARASLVIGFDPDPRYGGQLGLTGVSRKQRVDTSAGALYRPAGYARLDLGLWWQPVEQARLNLQLGNLTDRRYFDWASLRGATPTAHDLSLYRQPGRSLSLDLALDW